MLRLPQQRWVVCETGVPAGREDCGGMLGTLERSWVGSTFQRPAGFRFLGVPCLASAHRSQAPLVRRIAQGRHRPQGQPREVWVGFLGMGSTECLSSQLLQSSSSPNPWLREPPPGPPNCDTSHLCQATPHPRSMIRRNQQITESMRPFSWKAHRQIRGPLSSDWFLGQRAAEPRNETTYATWPPPTVASSSHPRLAIGARSAGNETWNNTYKPSSWWFPLFGNPQVQSISHSPPIAGRNKQT